VRFRSSRRSTLLTTVALPLALTIAACSSPVGNGVGPVAIIVNPVAGTVVTPQGVTTVYQCFEGAMTATLVFSDGSTGNFTNRVVWSSSDEGVVRVSNGDIPAPDGSGVYAAGTLIPVTSGNATVTAKYAAIVQNVPVSVGLPSNFTIRSVTQSFPTPVTAQTLGVGTTQQYSISAVTDGVEKDVSQYARWAIGGSIASVSSTGIVTALGVGGPGQLTASFLNCSNTSTANISVANINSIQLAPEFGTDPLQMINSEKINVLANLSDGSQQDVSLQATLTSTNTQIASFLLASNILQPAATGDVTVTATLNNSYLAPDQTISIISATLSDLSIAPTSAVVRAGSDQIVPFKATGTFTNGQVQDITRAVTWAVTDATLASISNVKATAGFVTANASITGQTTVTATPPVTDTTAVITSSILTVDSAANPAAPAPTSTTVTTSH